MRGGAVRYHFVVRLLFSPPNSSLLQAVWSSSSSVLDSALVETARRSSWEELDRKLDIRRWRSRKTSASIVSFRLLASLVFTFPFVSLSSSSTPS